MVLALVGKSDGRGGGGLIGPIPAARYSERRRRVLEALGAGVMVLPAAPTTFKSGDTERRYRPDSEMEYLGGPREPDALLVLRGHAVEDRFVLFVRGRDEVAERWTGPRLGPDGVRERFGADAAYPIEELEQRLPDLLMGSDRVHVRLGRDARVDRILTDTLTRARAGRARTGAGPHGLVDPGGVLDDLRLVKDDDEIGLIRTAVAITVEGFERALPTVRPGRGEWEVEALLDGHFRASGGWGPAFPSIVGSGPNACVLHYMENSARIGDGDLVLVDAGAEYRCYPGDLTRTVPASGRFSPEQRDVYDIVEGARALAVAAIAPGVTVQEVHRAALVHMIEGLIALGILAGSHDSVLESGAHRRFLPHSTSHWLGLDVHDVGDYRREGADRPLEPGMVLTVEPGLYLPLGSPEVPDALRGTGVRVEDDVLVTEQGAENLSVALPTAAEDVEALVGAR